MSEFPWYVQPMKDLTKRVCKAYEILGFPFSLVQFHSLFIMKVLVGKFFWGKMLYPWTTHE